MRRWRAVEHKSVPEVQAEQRALERAHTARGGVESILTVSPLDGGALTITFPTDAEPSPEARHLGAALGALDTKADYGRLFGAIDEALEWRRITTRESCRLHLELATLAELHGWMGDAEMVRLELRLQAGRLRRMGLA